MKLIESLIIYPSAWVFWHHSGFFFGVWAKTRFAKKSKNSIFPPKNSISACKNSIFQTISLVFGPFAPKNRKNQSKKAYFRPKKAKTWFEMPKTRFEMPKTRFKKPKTRFWKPKTRFSGILLEWIQVHLGRKKNLDYHYPLTTWVKSTYIQ